MIVKQETQRLHV